MSPTGTLEALRNLLYDPNLSNECESLIKRSLRACGGDLLPLLKCPCAELENYQACWPWFFGGVLIVIIPLRVARGPCLIFSTAVPPPFSSFSFMFVFALFFCHCFRTTFVVYPRPSFSTSFLSD